MLIRDEVSPKMFFLYTALSVSVLEVTLKSLEKEDCDVRYVVHCLQMLPEAAYSDNEFQKYIVLNPQSGKSEHAFRVKVRCSSPLVDSDSF